MHIPDGFIAPKMYIPAYVVAVGLWAVGIRRLKAQLSETAIPRLAVVTALAFVLMMVAVPLPGGTSVHATGIALIAVLFGPWVGFVAASVVLLLQALVFGIGGVTSLPINALAMGLAGGGIAWAVFRLLGRCNQTVALFAAGWLSITVPAALIAIVLGVQPALAHTADGTPLFFPFGLSVTIPAVMIPHVIVGVGEGVLTVLVYRLFRGIGRREES